MEGARDGSFENNLDRRTIDRGGELSVPIGGRSSQDGGSTRVCQRAARLGTQRNDGHVRGSVERLRRTRLITPCRSGGLMSEVIVARRARTPGPEGARARASESS